MPDGRQAISGGVDKTLRLWDLHTGQELARATLDVGVWCAAIVPGKSLAVVVGDAAGNVTYMELVEPA